MTAFCMLSYFTETSDKTVDYYVSLPQCTSSVHLVLHLGISLLLPAVKAIIKLVLKTPTSLIQHELEVH